MKQPPGAQSGDCRVPRNARVSCLSPSSHFQNPFWDVRSFLEVVRGTGPPNARMSALFPPEALQDGLAAPGFRGPKAGAERSDARRSQRKAVPLQAIGSRAPA